MANFKLMWVLLSMLTLEIGKVYCGRSPDQGIILKDFNLMKWMGANSFRTSHYPYSESIMDEADAQGFIVIDECPAVGLVLYEDEILRQHLVTIRELIERDKNRPSVLMWSIANEPDSNMKESGPYFEKVAAEARKLDPASRPLTAAIQLGVGELMAPSLDFIMLSRYFGWYKEGGVPQLIHGRLVESVEAFYASIKKPILISEYGAEAIYGLHAEPTSMFREDYQTEVLFENHKAFDTLRAKGYFAGEHIWNFADFNIKQKISYVNGHKKGVLTRDRQPKTSARVLRCRYWKLSGDVKNRHQEGFSYCPEPVY